MSNWLHDPFIVITLGMIAVVLTLGFLLDALMDMFDGGR